MSLEYDFLNRFEQPDFFVDPTDPALDEIRTLIRSGIETANDTLAIEMEQWVKELSEKRLEEIGWTLEESMILFLKWAILFPDRVSAWLQDIAAERVQRFRRTYRDEDKVPVARLQSDEFDAVMSEIQCDGIKVIIDDEGKESAIIMAWWLHRALLQITDPDHAQERIAAIEKACAEYEGK